MSQTNGITVVVDVAVVIVSVVVLAVVSLISSSYIIEIFISLPNRCSIATNIAIPLHVWVKLARYKHVTNTFQTRYITLQTRYNTLQTRYKHDTNTSQTRYKHVTKHVTNMLHGYDIASTFTMLMLIVVYIYIAKTSNN